MKIISFLILIVTSSFLVVKSHSPENIDPTSKNITVKAQIDSSENSISGVWEVEKLHHVILGKYSEYERGKSNSTNIDYDNLRFTFYEDGTGEHVNQFKETYPCYWSFTSTEQNGLELTVTGTTYNWEMLEITDKHLYASVRLTVSGTQDNLETFRLVKVGAKSSEKCDSKDKLISMH
ncbi:MAG: hypothetical protein V4722_03615 [Bacteroidota bacterium]